MNMHFYALLALPLKILLTSRQIESARSLAERWNHSLRTNYLNLSIPDKDRLMAQRYEAIRHMIQGLMLWALILFVATIAALTISQLLNSDVCASLKSVLYAATMAVLSLGFVISFKDSAIKAQLQRYRKLDDARKVNYSPSRLANPGVIDIVLATPITYSVWFMIGVINQ